MQILRPIIKDQFQAYMTLCPHLVLVYAVAAVISVSRALYVFVVLKSESFIEAIGLFSPWFNSWIVMLLIGVAIGFQQDRISKLAAANASTRKSFEYGMKY